jgi:hypothetical protein
MTRALCSALALLAVGMPSPANAQAKDAAPAGAPAPPSSAAGSPGPPGPYYLEPPEAEPPASDAPPAASAARIVLEPPAPGTPPTVIFEPPPPPAPRHVAPNTSLWLGARLGWFVPFGNIYTRTLRNGTLLEQHGVAWRDYATSGPMFELDLGARLSRSYNVFALWERAELGAGRGDGGLLGNASSTTGGDSDFWAVGVRASSDVDRVGFLSEIALGYRRARSEWDDGSTLELTQGLFEARLGFGADIRISPKFALSPMLTFGVGLFGKVALVDQAGVAQNLLQGDNDQDGHAWLSLQIGGHFDLRAGR